MLCRAELVNLEELSKHMNYICHTPDASKVEMIRDVLTKMDFDQDGSVKVDHVLGVLELMLDEHTSVPPKLVEDIIEMMAKEEQLETATLIQHALRKTIEENTQKKNPEAETDAAMPSSVPHEIFDKMEESHETRTESEGGNDKHEFSHGIGDSPDAGDNAEDKKQANRSQ